MTSLGKFDFELHYNLSFVYWVLFSTLNDALIANVIFHKVFLTINCYSTISSFLGQLGIRIFNPAQYICQFNSVGSISSPVRFFVAPVKKLSQVSTRKIFENLTFSLVSKAAPTGLLRHSGF